MLPKPIASHILTEVRHYDPLLNIRWSHEKGCFCVERKADRRFLPSPVKWSRNGKPTLLPELSERRISWERSAIPIYYVKKLDRRILWKLHEDDSYRLGRNTKQVVGEVEYREKKAEERQEAKDSEKLGYIGSEAYESMKRRGGERISI